MAGKERDRTWHPVGCSLQRWEGVSALRAGYSKVFLLKLTQKKKKANSGAGSVLNPSVALLGGDSTDVGGTQTSLPSSASQSGRSRRSPGWIGMGWDVPCALPTPPDGGRA